MKTKLLKIILIISTLLLSVNYTAQESKNQHLVDSILQKVSEIPYLKKKVIALTGNAGKFRYREYTKAFIDEAIKISEKENDPEAKAHSYYSLGNFYFFRLKTDTAKILFNRALDLLNPDSSSRLEAQILTSIAGIQKKEGNYSQAVFSLFKAKEILEKTDTARFSFSEKYYNIGQISVIDNSLATLYTKMEDYESAIYYFDLCYNASLELKNNAVAGVVLSNKGELLTKMKKYKEALETQKKGKELKISGKAPARSIALSVLNIGIVLSETNKLEEALVSFNKALNVFEKVNYPTGKMNTLTSRGFLFIKTNSNNKAIEDCEKAKKIAFKLNDIEYQKKSCECLYKAYKINGNSKLALENHEIFLEKKETILNEKSVKKITQLEMQYDFDRKEEILEVESLAKEKENKAIITNLIWGLGALLLIALLLYRLFRIRNKSSIELENKNTLIKIALDEKEVLLKEIHHRVKNNLQIISSLLSIQGRQIENPQAKQAINEGKNRVKAMALIHQNLYQSDNLVGVDAQEYIHKLTDSLVQNYNTSDNDIEITTNIDHLKLDIETIIPFGLIINELISNSLKYAFPEATNQGKILIKLVSENENLILEVSDNGVGLPENFDIEKTSSLGYKLIKAFSKKLNASLTLSNSTAGVGTKVKLEITSFKTI